MRIPTPPTGDYALQYAKLDRECPRCGQALTMLYNKHGFTVSCRCNKWGFNVSNVDPGKFETLEEAYDYFLNA